MPLTPNSVYLSYLTPTPNRFSRRSVGAADISYLTSQQHAKSISWTDHLRHKEVTDFIQSQCTDSGSTSPTTQDQPALPHRINQPYHTGSTSPTTQDQPALPHRINQPYHTGSTSPTTQDQPALPRRINQAYHTGSTRPTTQDQPALPRRINQPYHAGSTRRLVR